jgi:hypothetical protein
MKRSIQSGIRLACLVCSLLSPLYANAQSFLSVTGQVVDRETREPLPYASLSVKGKPVGTVANSEGKFTFHVPDTYARDTLLISFLGYESYASVLERALSKTTFALSKKAILLDELLVRNQPVTAREIIAHAMAGVEKNYPTEPYLMEGFFRDWSRNQMPESYAARYGIRRSGSLLEAAVGIYGPGYANSRRKTRMAEEVYIRQIRQSRALPEEENHYNWLTLLLKGNHVRYNQAGGNVDMFKGPLDQSDSPDYQLKGLVEEEGEKLYLITVPAVPLHPVPEGSTAWYYLYISQQDHAILRIDLLGTPAKGQFYHLSRHDSQFQCTQISNTLRFKRYQGKLYMAYVRAHWTTNRIGADGTPLETYEHHKELLINQITTTNVDLKRHTLGTPRREKQALNKQVSVYDPKFWQHYNLIRENPVDRELLQLLEKEQKLEEQFHSSPSKK